MTSGQVLFEGEDIAEYKGDKLKALRREMQMIFQDPYSSLNPRKTVGSIIAEPFVIHKMLTGAGERKKRVQELMDRVGLNPEHYNRYPHEFSGGQRQRIGVARAIALEPKVLSPTSRSRRSTSRSRRRCSTCCATCSERSGLTLIFIAHDLSVVRHMCDRVAVMYLGKVVELAVNEDLYGHPRHPYTGALLSAVPVPEPPETSASATCSPATCRAPPTRRRAAASTPAARRRRRSAPQEDPPFEPKGDSTSRPATSR